MAITHLDTQKDSLCTQLHDFILAVGWSDGSSNLDYAEKFDLPFSIPRLWLQHGITGVLRGLRVISDQMFRPVIYDLAALQAYQNHRIGKTVLKRRMVYFLIECLAKREQSRDTGKRLSRQFHSAFGDSPGFPQDVRCAGWIVSRLVNARTLCYNDTEERS